MKKLTSEQVELLHEMMAGSLSYQLFLQKIDIEIDMELCFNLLLEAKAENDASMFRNVLWGLVPQLSYTQKLLLYRMALIDQWHHEHEELVQAFQTTYNQEQENIKYIKIIMQHLPGYMANTVLKDSFIRKCAYAIAAQPTPHKELALNELSAGTDAIIVKYALHQLQKIEHSKKSSIE
ncbi:MAG: hypothetical protein HUU01_07370 [Saprospiraceae bacterium]|nr:hypothetical protein [Saprospiraceae bacterium]